MKEERILEGLNNKQVEAVRAINGPILVISGPGSGKTKCLTHRIAYLIFSEIRAENILAVTFTNKAANEMRERIMKLLGKNSDQLEGKKFYLQTIGLPLIGTFHSICLKILRREVEVFGYGKNFNIFDTDDQLSVLKRVLAELEIDIKKFNPRAILSRISKIKTDLIPADKYRGDDFFSKIVEKAYGKYQSELKKANAVDFDDLIFLTVKLFREYPEVLKRYQGIWHYILVDEYQDTSHDQYVLINLLASEKRNLFAIGDDAQSIYQFRQADIRNILHFEKDYPDAQIILLEQNYRSTKNIISAAQEIISNNQSQIKKNLWTDNDGGEKIEAIETLNERHEATSVISRVEELMDKENFKANDFAILYRTHAQSRAMEEALIMRGFPYQIIGGIKFYERKEIKDIIAYLRFINNPSDIVSFERIYNIPTRGIGKTTFDKIIATGETDLIIAIDELASSLKSRQENLNSFSELLKDLKSAISTKKLSSIIKYIIKETDYEVYIKEYSSNKSSKALDHEENEDRLDNLKELLTVAQKYDHLGTGNEGIEAFLEEITLIQETDKVKTSSEQTEKITLMTTHASKGLEFPIVFVLGMEEGIFPHSRSLINPQELEEERRLCYVAVTRAKKRLILSFAKYRHIYGSTESNLPSRFISEIPQNLIEYKSFANDDYEFEEKVYY